MQSNLTKRNLKNRFQNLGFCFTIVLAAWQASPLVYGANPQEPNPTEERAASESLAAAAEKMEARMSEFPELIASKWKAYYRWSEWGEPLARGETPPSEQLREVLPRFYGFFEGLDEPAFLQMREELKAHLEGTAPPQPIGSAPSLLLRFNRELVDSILQKKAETTHVHQQTGNWIAGAWVTGAAECRIDATAVLSPQQEPAAVLVKLDGIVWAPQTVAQSGRFRIYGSAQSRVQGEAELILQDGVFRATRPRVWVNTESRMHDVDGPRPFRRLAMRVAERRGRQGELEGAAIITKHVTEEAERRLQEEAEKLNAALGRYQGSLALLKRLDIVPSKVGASVVEDQLQFGMFFSDSGAEGLPAYEAPQGTPAVEVVLHESFLSAFPRKFLKGVWWTGADFEQLKSDLRGGGPTETFVATSEMAPAAWGVRWDWRAPVTTRISGEEVECELRFSQFQFGQQRRREGLAVRAKFRPVAEGGQVAFRRVSSVEATSLKEGAPLSDEEKAFLERRFEEICGEAIPLSGLNPPTGAGVSALSLLTNSAVRVEEGWLRIGFQPTGETWTSRLAGIMGGNAGKAATE